MADTSSKSSPCVTRYALLAVGLWSLVMLGFLLLDALRIRGMAVSTAQMAARAQIEKDVVYRRWNALQDGFYVPVSGCIQPNPYLTQVKQRDIRTSSGLTLTYINPAYMTRLVHELGRETSGIRGHITSLNPIRPANAPDAWERRALECFEQGEPEYFSIEACEGQPYLRLMKPLMVEDACLKCHAQQGYREGDVRGGLSVAMPMAPYLALSWQQVATTTVGHLVCWLLGVGGIWVAMNRLTRAQRRIYLQQEALRETEARQRAMIANITDVIAILDGNGRNRYISPNLEKWFGWRPEERNGSNIHPDDRPSVQAALTALRHRPGASTTIECRYRCRNGQYKWIECTATNLLQDPTIQGILINYHDITERVEMEQALRESEAHYRAFLHEATNGILRQDLVPPMSLDLDVERQIVHIETHARIAECNRAFTRLHGWDEPSDLVGKRLVDLPGGPDADRYRAHIRKFIESNYRLGGEETEEAGPDGQMRHFANNTIGILEEGHLVHIWSTQVEITASKRVEQALRESEQKYRLLFEMESDALFLIDNETGNILDINAAAVSLYGYSREELLHMRNVDLSAEPTATRSATDQGLKYIPVRYHRKKDRTVFPVEITATVLTQKGRQVHIPAIRDITERMQAEEEREKLREQLRQAQKMESVGRLAGGVAHDFNNMLGVILGQAEMALERLDPSQPLFTALQEICKAAARSAHLTRQLLAFARKQTIAPRRLDLNETVDGMLLMLRRLIGENIELIWLPAPQPCQVQMDPTQLDQILVNLCVNARDAMTGSGRLTIETQRLTLDAAQCADHADVEPGDFVCLSVADTGHGIPPETLAHIFEPFFTTKDGGTGLGLATVYGIATQNHGFVSVSSEPERGTRFEIYLPGQIGETAPPPSPGNIPSPPPRGRETVLLVEDEPAILEMTSMLLDHLGYTVLSASTPDEAIRLAQCHAGQIALLMTDVVMPEMNGRVLARHLNAMIPGLRCLFMSGYTADVIAPHGVLDPGVHFIEKPFSRDELASRLRTALEDRPLAPSVPLSENPDNP